MSFDLDQECRHAKERLRVSIEANAAYELKQMRKKYSNSEYIKVLPHWRLLSGTKNN